MASTDLTQFTITAQGHPNIQATHSSTLEITMDPHLTMKGDCVIGVNASHSAQHLNTALGDVLRLPETQIRTKLTIGIISDEIHGFGSPELTLTSPTSLVWRTSDFIDARTIAIHCNKAAKDLNRRLIDSLQDPETVLQVALIVYTGVK